MGFIMPLPFSGKSHCLTIIWIHLHSTYIFPPRHTLPNTPHLSLLTLTGSFAITLAGICRLVIQWCSLSLRYVLQLLNNLQFYLLSTIGMMSILYFIAMYLLTKVIWSLFQSCSNRCPRHRIRAPYFPASMYSSKYSPSLECVDFDSIFCHYARWDVSPDRSVVLSLSRVSYSSITLRDSQFELTLFRRNNHTLEFCILFSRMPVCAFAPASFFCPRTHRVWLLTCWCHTQNLIALTIELLAYAFLV